MTMHVPLETHGASKHPVATGHVVGGVAGFRDVVGPDEKGRQAGAPHENGGDASGNDVAVACSGEVGGGH